ncbi:MAG: immunoglobulin domain-containing protein, partial [Bacteroidales bacterium]|nr:immunoglobulin domain-containing protein [Bacteroidales bacterium]
MNSRFFTTALLLLFFGFFAIPESNAQSNTTQPDTVCVSSTEFYRVDSAAGSHFVWGLKYGGGTILSNPIDSAARIKIQWNATVGFDTLWVVEYNLHGCAGDTNKIRVGRFTVPALVVSGNNFSICEGSIFSVNVAATGIPLLTYQWKFNGIDIPGATAAALSISGLNATHAGIYTCTVSNPCGFTVTENITLVVKFNPVITLQPIAISTCPGATINLSTANTGTGPFTYVWKKDGITVSDGGGITGATTANIQIAGMTLSNTGNYTCTITNSCATVVTTSILVNINVPPVITQQPLSVSICEAEPTNFNFIVTGDSLFYQWKFEGVDIPGATGTSLNFSPAQYPDTGTYTCYISNTCGNVTTANAVLNMNIPPAITVEPDSISTCVGQNIALNVTVTGDSLFYQWKKEGIDLPGATSTTLAFTPVTYADTGNYTLFIYNTCGNVTSQNANININIPPVIVSQTGNISSCLGNSATMQVIVTGDSLFYQWKRNGVDVAGANSPTLVINPVTLANTGNYICTITNTCGNVSSVSLALTVNIVPVITQHPVNKSSCLGNTHMFTVVATGDSLNYQWRRNGVDIAGATLSTYTVSPVTLGNVGTYTCYVYNTCGNQLSNPANLTVNISPVITVQPQHKSSCIGNSHTFSVTVTGDSLNYQWKRNGVNIPGAIASTYTVNPVSLANTGTYQVVITNTCGTVSSNIVNLTVNIVPVITQQPVNKSSCLGNSHTFSVIATGDSLNYQWRRNGVDIAGATFSTITINPVTLGNTGAYTCYVYNTCGNQLSNVANLSVNIAPIITVQPKPKSSCLGLSHTFNVSATGDSLKYQWKFNGVNIPGAISSSYTVNPISLLNTGAYQVVVSNTCGIAPSNTVNLTVNIAPVITLHPVKKSSCLGFSHTFSITATGDSLKYQWRRNGVDIVGATASTYTVNPITLSNTGAYTCYVYNTCGNQLSNAANLTINIAPVITVQPKHKSSCLGQSHTFSVIATGDSLKYQWKFNGVNIPGAVASTYTVNPVSLLNTGPYQVVVYNTCGIVPSNIVNLTVNIAPVITLHPKTISSCIGNSVTLNIAATGDSLKYQWRRDGINVPGATSASLTINPVNLTNTGYYTCVISNTCGTQTTNSGRLTVNVAPVITLQPKKVSTCPGLSTGFTVTATGDSLKYQWYKNSFLMPGKTSPNITFSPVTYADTADYYLRIYNTCGTINTVSVNLNINIPPVITRHPKSLLTCVGDSSAMTVVVSGDSLFYQWRFNGVNIPGSTNRILPIDPVTLASIGIYDVRITNTCGQAISDTAHLYANIDPSVIINPKSISSCLGNTETLRVGIVAGGSALPNFQWYKDGVLIPGATDTLLVITNITLAKTGAYYCELWNNCDAINTTTAFLTVNIAPVITSQPQNISTCIGNSVAFNMTVTGDSLKYQWYKDGFPLAGATTPNLAFNPVNAGHVGFYYCKVWNTCGTLNSQNVQLYMNTPPGITLQPVNRKACAGDNVILQVAGSGDFLQYQWFKDGVIVAGATNATLQFNPVAFVHKGAYQCRVQNTCGTAWSNIVNIWVNTTPIITTQPQGISTCAGTTVILNTIAIGDSITYQWKLEGIDIPGANAPTYTINNIQFIQTGNYTCYLSTRCGVVMTQQARVTINRVPVITSQPVDVSACAGDFISIGFGITGDSLFYRWQKDGINIPGANQPTLDFAAISVTDRGIYRCYIWNTCGNVWTTDVNVWVNILPAVVTQPLSATRCEDDSVSFRVTPVGDFITIQWYRNNVAITGATTNVFSIPRISMSDAGQYFCRVTSQSCGYSDSQIATLTVVQKFVVSAVTSNITCNGNTNAAIDITITGGALPLTYKWSNGATTQDLTGLTPGTYTVSIRDQNNCKVRKSISVDQPDVLAFVHDTTNWSNALRMGGAGNDKISDIRTDRFGNTYVTGHFQSNSNFQTQSLTSFGDDDIFLAKYNAAGNLSWIKQAGGTLKDQGRGLALDTLGNIYLTGTFTQMAFFGATQVNANGNTDAFLAKYDNNGNFQWVKNYGGFFDDAGNSIFTDEGGYSWVTGSFQGISTFGANTLISRGGDDVYLAKFDNLGAMQWVQQAGGTSEDFGHQVMVDISEHAIITGRFQGTATFGSTNIVSSGNNDIFMAKYNTLGNLLWVRKAGGIGNDLGRDVTIDQSQNIYLTGNIEGTASFGATNVTSNGLKDAFTAKYDKNGNPQWVRTIGGTGIDNAKAIYVDVLGNAYTTGSFRNSMVLGDKTLTSAGQSDIFVTKHNTNGYLVWSQQAGGAGADSSMTIFMRNDKNLVLGGSFTASASFAPGTLVSSGGDDAFMVRLNQVAVPTPPVITPVNCFGGTEGGIDITVGGGTLPYQYLWSNGANTEDLVNIPEGTYWLFVNDINACQLNTTLQVNFLFPFPEPPTSASVDRNFFCTNDAGNITLTAVGGSGDILEWYENSCGGTSIA